MKKSELPFGKYVKQKRESLGMTIRVFAAEVKISPSYLCDIENGKRSPPEKLLEIFSEVLKINNKEELHTFYDLAGISSKTGKHNDINNYIENLPAARMALRVAKENHYTNEDWLKLIDIIKQKTNTIPPTN